MVRSPIPASGTSSPASNGSRTLVVLSTARSGTHLLAHQLARGGHLGPADEYFHGELIADFAKKFNVATTPLHEYYAAVHAATSTECDISAVVVFPHHVEKLAASGLLPPGVEGLAALLEALPNPSVLTLERRSLVDQTLSFNRSTQSGIWTLDAGEAPPEHPPYDFESLAAHLLRMQLTREWVLEAEQLIGAFARLTYEEIVADENLALSQVAAHFGIDIEAAVSSDEAASPRPARAADHESQRRREQMLTDMGRLVARLGWDARPSHDGLARVESETVTASNRQLLALTESAQAERATSNLSQLRLERRPADNIRSRIGVAATRQAGHDVQTVHVLEHGLDASYLDRFYRHAASSRLGPRFVRTWAQLPGADLVHINSVHLGWGFVAYEQKRALVDRALASLDSLDRRGVPLIWTAHEPLLPGTKHVRMESAVCSALADQARVIHVRDEAMLAALEQFATVDRSKVTLGDVLPTVQTHSKPAARRLFDLPDDAILFTIVGPLDPYPQLGDLEWMAQGLKLSYGPKAVLLLAGHSGGAPPLAYTSRLLARSGAVVVQASLTADEHDDIVKASDALLAPVHKESRHVGAAASAWDLGTPCLVTACPGSAGATLTVQDWTDQQNVLALLEQALEPVDTIVRPSTDVVSIVSLARGLTESYSS